MPPSSGHFGRVVRDWIRLPRALRVSPETFHVFQVALTFGVIFFVLLYTQQQTVRYYYAKTNPATKQEIVRSDELPWPMITLCNVRANTNLTALHCTAKGNQKKSKCMPYTLVKAASTHCLEYNTQGLTSTNSPNIVILVNIHYATTARNPLWGASVIVHNGNITNRAIHSPSFYVPAGQAGVGRVRKHMDVMLNGTTKEMFEVKSMSTLKLDYPGYDVTTVAGVSLRWETTDIEVVQEYIEYTFDDLLGLSAGVAGIGDLLMRFMTTVLHAMFVDGRLSRNLDPAELAHVN